MSEAAPYWEPHWVSRTATVALHVQNTGISRQMIIGDSNTEGFWWSSIGGGFVVNAGMGGASIRTIADRAPYIANAARPRITHLMIGSANVKMGEESPEWETMESDLNTIVDAFTAFPTKMIVWPVPPVASEHAAVYPHSRRSAVNALLAAVASQRGVFWDWWWPNQITQGPHVSGVVTNNYAAPGAMAPDGLHFSGASQSSRYARLAAWKQTLAASPYNWPCP